MILHHKFIDTAKKNGNKLAIIDKMVGTKATYSKALIGSLVLQNKLKKYDERYIGIMIPNSAGAMLTTIATLMSGKIPVMINYSTGAGENCLMAQNKCNFKTIITSRALLEKQNCPLIDGMVCIEDLITTVTGLDKLFSAIKSKLPKAIIKAILPKSSIDDTACILFTSGSEKEPKAVQLSHKNLGSNVEDVIDVLKLTKKDTIFSILPLFHVFGIQTNFWMPLTLGMTVVTYANPLDYKNIPKIIREERCTLIAATPIFLSGYLRSSKPGDFASLELIVAGADKTPQWLRDEYKEKHNIEIVEGYGATETSPVVSVNHRDNNKPGSIGLVVPNAKVKITNIDTGEPLPPGVEGKILVKGDLVMKGYMDDIKTKEVIVNGWYDTGDIGILDEDGFLWHRGRLKRFVKIGGEMVSLVNTESVISNIVDKSIDCCVVDVPDEIKGSSLVAVLTKEIDKDELIKSLGQNLPQIAIPKKYIFLEDLPKMGSGKVDFRSVEKLVREEVTV
ncbi:bifunctional acyl-ACP--phospholipid O-acyltransferase/long-chain-fatty-acid--ACP ligase [Thiospirochaeta perfilievii]|uniref:Bifunctional acyl-ACP--phospholipid O-acyltransferase/long-chain-fatty-acid--ACP ligase n=1 Tax=Thiospirochaeta perfilievii TaxID=252967 RepID=A0A5C1QEC8_9SPIO|nr:AMP-binding protein [Thiospirochaeta perfilievii]QEN05420.1 bifunctional acyl-ACP--phospholipid O-acyltransferase/long-chain-fatty-acid--ACP ligase [Thiospirochaeta perfilievii]